MTKLIVDHVMSTTGVKMGEIYIDLDETGITGANNPTGIPDPITRHQYLAWLAQNPAIRAQAGYEVPHKIGGNPNGETLWQRVLSETSKLPVGHPLHNLTALTR